MSWRTLVSRSGVPSVPWKYLEATMFVAVMDHVFGTSTFFCSKITSPDSLVIAAVRYSHSTRSKGDTPSRVKYLRNSSPFWAVVTFPLPSAFRSRTSSFMDSPFGLHRQRSSSAVRALLVQQFTNTLCSMQYTVLDIVSRIKFSLAMKAAYQGGDPEEVH